MKFNWFKAFDEKSKINNYWRASLFALKWFFRSYSLSSSSSVKLSRCMEMVYLFSKGLREKGIVVRSDQEIISPTSFSFSPHAFRLLPANTLHKSHQCSSIVVIIASKVFLYPLFGVQMNVKSSHVNFVRMNRLGRVGCYKWC